MEEDRDRQKKAREDSWLRHPDPLIEFEEAWKKAHALSQSDYEIFEKLQKRYETETLKK